jgi:hypothetical protein
VLLQVALQMRYQQVIEPKPAEQYMYGAELQE